MSKYLKMFQEKQEKNNEELLKMKREAEKDVKDKHYFVTEADDGK